MKERMVSFSPDMVRAILAGRKTLTRRPVDMRRIGYIGPSGCQNDPESWGYECDDGYAVLAQGHNGQASRTFSIRCPLGSVGDVILVRERASVARFHRSQVKLQYEADGAESHWMDWPSRIKHVGPGMCIPNGVFREGARIRLVINDVRVERLQCITPEDAQAEGLAAVTKNGQLYKYGIPDRDGYPGTDNHGWPWVEWNRNPCVAFTRIWDDVYGAPDPKTKEPSTRSWAANPWVWVVGFKVQQ